MRVARAWGVATVLAAGFALGGCAGAEPSYADLERQATPEDAFPGIDDTDLASLDADTARLAGESDGVQVWVAEGEEQGTVCIVLLRGGDDWMAGCGGGEVRLSGVGSFILVPDGTPAPSESAVAISENVYRLDG